MRSLFGRIFIWFCATVLAGVSLTIFVGPLLSPPREVQRLWTMTDYLVLQTGAAVIREYEQGDAKAAAGIMAGLREAAGQRALYIFDQAGQEIAGQPVPEAVRRAVREAPTRPARPAGPLPLPWKPGEFREPPPMVRTYDSLSGRRYFLAFVPPPPPPRKDFLIHGLASGLIPLLLAAGILFSFVLARSLTAPLRKLKATVRSLGRGDLAARSGGGSRWDHREISELSLEFDRMAERIEVLVESQRALMRDISHELRTPLTRLIVALALARQRTGAEAAAALDRIEKDAARLEGLIDQILAFSRIESQSGEYQFTVVNLGALVVSICSDADLEMLGRDVYIDTTAVGPVLATGSEELIRRAVENVIRNAVHHSPQGTTVLLEVARKDTPGGPMAEIAVRDSGPGVPEAALDKIFEPFFRVAASPRAVKGAGLGLAITRRALEMHGGAVSAGNRPQGGLEVVMRLPALACQSPDPQ